MSPLRRFARTLGLGLAAVLIAGAAVAAPRAGSVPHRPFLRIEAGGHIGAVARLSVDEDGRLMASAGYDKTVRLWSLPGGQERAVLRVPIGPGHEGELYAVALTPDGRRVFAAGATGGSWDGTFSIYLFSVRRARLIGRLPGLPAPVFDLAVSPDGTRFAAGLARGGMREWDAHSGKLVAADPNYAGPVRRVAFGAGNQLYTTAADGKLRAYDAAGHLVASRVPEPGIAALGPGGLAGWRAARGDVRAGRQGRAAGGGCGLGARPGAGVQAGHERACMGRGCWPFPGRRRHRARCGCSPAATRMGRRGM